jgi:PAS domain S-box-containing protein
MLSTWATNKWAQLVRQFLVLLGFFMVYVSLLGYIYHIQPAYRLGGFTPMALLTSIVFLVLYVGLFVSNTRYGISKSYASNLAGGHLLRKIIPLLLLLPPITGYLSLLGEQKGIYPTEFGIGIYTLVFTLVVFVFVTMHASMENKKHLYSMQTQQLLEESEQKFRSVFNSLREGVMSTTPEGLLLFSNPSMSRITGYSEAQLKGKNAMELLQPDSLRNLQHHGPEYGTLMPGDYQTQIVTMSGERLWVAVKALPVLNEHGVTSHIISTFTDITAEKIKLQDLSAFTASAAHDLNSPVARISMLANMFDATNLSEEQKWYLNSIKEVSHSMGQLLKDLLSFSRLGAGSLEKSLLDVNKLVEAVVTMQMPANFAGEINVQHLPPMIANESAMRQLFTNLVSNAIKYSSKSPHPTIWIEACEQNGQTVYCVRDNGVGLREEQIKQLFTPFRRFHAQFEGNGMGLAIVKRIVEKHNGTIWAEPNEPQGLSIKFTVGSEVPQGI